MRAFQLLVLERPAALRSTTTCPVPEHAARGAGPGKLVQSARSPMTATESVLSVPIARPRGAVGRSGFNAGMSVSLLLLTIAGFWPQYYRPLLFGTRLEPLLEHWGFALHSSASLGWMIAFAVQSILVWRGRTDLHRRFGPSMAAYGVVVIVLDLYAGVGIEVHRLRHGEPLNRAAAFLFLVTRDLVMFGGFLAAAIAWRRRPALHGRLMFLATLSIAMVGFGRLVGRLLLPEHRTLFELVCLLPIALAMVHDWRTRGRVHGATVVGLVLFFVRLRYLNFGFGLTGAWQPIGQALLRPFL